MIRPKDFSKKSASFKKTEIYLQKYFIRKYF